MNDTIRMTEFSHGAGCGCKLSPAVLDILLHSDLPVPVDPALLVGNSSRDDAAVYDLGNGTSIISTTDFFMPIVDDPFDFGRIAATNAISDIYAMAGKPLMAIAIFAWPLDKLPSEVGQQVIDGGRSVCGQAGISLAGGHSIDAPEPIFGLAVTGIVDTENLKRNSTARAGDLLFLTKPLGIGILSTAQKKKLIRPEHVHIASDTMCQLNKIGYEFGQMPGVSAMTDVTGFGLAGHLSEICEASGLCARVEFEKLPILPHVYDYLEQGCSPGGASRNYESYGDKIDIQTEEQKSIVCDPQTSGGLLVCVAPGALDQFRRICQKNALELEPIGVLSSEPSERLVNVS